MPNKPTAFNKAAGERLRLAVQAIMEKHSITARGIAKQIGTSESAMANWMAGRAAPQPEPLAAAKSLYGLSIDWVYTGDAQGLPGWLREAIYRPKPARPPASAPKPERQQGAAG